MTEAQTGRWYMVNRDGMATLCVDREDAEKEAANANLNWPKRLGPHRAVRLVEASFEAADMATASAQGFRDGVASVSAWSEPVAEIGSAAGDCAAFGERALYPLVDIDRFDYGTMLYAHPLPKREWMPISEMRAVVAVAVTMLYDTHPEDVLRVFDLCELEKISIITMLLGSQQVEDIYRSAWDHLTAATGPTDGESNG